MLAALLDRVEVGDHVGSDRALDGLADADEAAREEHDDVGDGQAGARRWQGSRCSTPKPTSTQRDMRLASSRRPAREHVGDEEGRGQQAHPELGIGRLSGQFAGCRGVAWRKNSARMLGSTAARTWRSM